MTRLARRRAGYVAALAVWGAPAGLAAWLAGPPALVAMAVVLMIPGRIQGMLWRDFFRGSHLLRTGRPAEAIPHLERFRDRVAADPRLRRAVWLSWPGYTADVEAMGRGHVLAFGLVADPAGAFGMGLVEFADEAAARAFTDADPTITPGRGFAFEVHPMPFGVLRP